MLIFDICRVEWSFDAVTIEMNSENSLRNGRLLFKVKDRFELRVSTQS